MPPHKEDKTIPNEAIKAVAELKEQIALQSQDCIFLTRAEIELIPNTTEVNNSSMIFNFVNSCRVPVSNIKSSLYSLNINKSIGFKELVSTSPFGPGQTFHRRVTLPDRDLLGKNKFFAVTIEQGAKSRPKAYFLKINYLSNEYKDFHSTLIQITPDDEKMVIDFLREQGVYNLIKILEERKT